MEGMRPIILAALIALAVSACGSSGGGSPVPVGSGAATEAPKATATPVKTAGPTGNPGVDNYGY